MTNRRATITLTGIPAGARVPRLDDFVEIEPAAPAVCAVPGRSGEAPARVQRDIVSRLENWARWCTSSESGIAAACMTGAICEALRKAQAGVLHGGSNIGPSIDTADAALVGRGMVRIDLNHRRLLGLHYVDGERIPYIAARLQFPRQDFEKRMAAAQDALEAALLRMSQNSNSQQFP